MKKLIKENIIFILIFIFGIFITWVPIPYYVEGPGGLISLEDRFSMDGETVSNYHLAYVSSYNGTILNVLLSFLSKDYNVYPETKESGTNKEVDFRNHLLLEEANQDAFIYAYLKAGKEVNINSEEVYITYIDELAKTDLQVGDKLISMDDVEINSKKEVKEYIEKKEIGDKISFQVMHNQKKYTRYADVIEVEGQKVIGVLPTLKRNVEVHPTIDFSFEESESGSSGGFMTSLAIYDLLIEEDIAHGLKIAGTGTIDLNGDVGEIGGIQYKIMGALEEDVDVFFLPEENLEDAKKTLDRKGKTLNLVAIKHFDEALEYLKNV